MAKVRNLSRVLQRLQAARTLPALYEICVSEIQALTGYDRVLIYHFHEEGHGQVIAEASAPAMELFNGMFFPASDIPVQARELYRTHWLRIIPDAAYEPVQLVPKLRPDTGQALDLQRVQAQVLGKVGCDAVAQRVAGGQHHAGLVGLACGAHPAGHGLQLSCQVVGEGAGLECVAEQRQRARAANHHVGRAQVGQRGGAEAGHAVVEHADDAAAVGIVGGQVVHSVSKSKWWVWPMPVRPAVAGRGRASTGAERTSATSLPLKSHTSTRSANAWP